MSDPQSRRAALKCMAFGGAGTLFALSGGIPLSLSLAEAATPKHAGLKPLFVQISDTHIGFAKDANPDPAATLTRAIALANALPQQPAFIMHTGDVTHLSKPSEFDTAAQLLKSLRTGELHVVPGEHDAIDNGAGFMNRFGAPSGGKGYYSFDSGGVHFIALVNVFNFKQNGLGALGSEQLAWVDDDLKSRPASQPIVVFAHMPLWTIYEPWGWGTSDAPLLMSYLKRFGSVTVLNGHIHQIVQKTEGHMVFHTARSTAFPQPSAGNGDAPGPMKVPPEQLASMLGITSISLKKHALALTDETLSA